MSCTRRAWLESKPPRISFPQFMRPPHATLAPIDNCELHHLRSASTDKSLANADTDFCLCIVLGRYLAVFSSAPGLYAMRTLKCGIAVNR
jgi:hypothetical protein